MPVNGPFEVENVYEQAIRDKFEPPFFGWYFYNNENHELKGIQESFKYLQEYVNENGPFDGVFGFSQGTIMARLLLKFAEYPSIKFAILFSPLLSFQANYIPDDPEATKKLASEYSQSMFYSYGELEADSEYITQSIVKQGDYTLVIHKYGHNIPKFIEDDMLKFGTFLKKVYTQITGGHIEIGKCRVIDFRH